MKRLLWIIPAVYLIGCNGGKDQTNIEVIDNMMDQESIKSQDWDFNHPGVSQMRTPPAGTVPRGFQVYKYAADPEAAEKNLVNPLAGDKSDDVHSKGKKFYNTYCSVCHGIDGKGDGTVAAKMPLKPPPLLSDKVKNFKDGRIFHIMTVGQGVMGSYATQITDPKTRWAVVNYIRTLQGKGN